MLENIQTSSHSRFLYSFKNGMKSTFSNKFNDQTRIHILQKMWNCVFTSILLAQFCCLSLERRNMSCRQNRGLSKYQQFLTQRNSDTDFTLFQGEHPGWIRMHQHETCHYGVTRTVLKCMILTHRTADVTLHGMRVMEHVSCITPFFAWACLLRTK